MQRVNPILAADSYKAGHYAYYPEGLTEVTSYLTPRGGVGRGVLSFGLQAVLLEHFTDPVTLDDVSEAAAFFAEHGEPFNLDGWTRIAAELGGRLPLEIRAVPEGEDVRFGEPLLTVRNTVPGFHWLPSYVETKLMRVWYPTTVATFSARLRAMIDRHAAATCDDPEAAAQFRLHDFGARGSTSQESAALGGAAHLVNFLGSDTVEGIVGAQRWYDAPMAGYSVIATEHSTMTTWGEDGEADAFRAMVSRHGKPGAILSIVSDSYDTRRVLTEYLPALKDEIVASGCTVVVRLDSGDPVQMVLQALNSLWRTFGARVNGKGYRVLSDSVRVLQGDGIGEDTLRAILDAVTRDGWATENVVFGMGGALLQKHNRDTFKFAYKACEAVFEDGRREGVWKRSEDAWKSSRPLVDLDTSALVPVYRDGELLRRWTFDEVRAAAAKTRVHLG